jgi:hypothetical protein
MAHSRNSRFRIKAARRGIEAMRHRERGLTYAEIAEEMGISEQRAWKLVSKEFDRLNEKRTEKATDVLRLELSRLDTMLSAVWENAQAGDLKAIAAALKIVERRAALLGLHLIRHEVKVSNEHAINICAIIDQYAAELRLEARPNPLQGDPASNGRGEPVGQASANAEAKSLSSP